MSTESVLKGVSFEQFVLESSASYSHLARAMWENGNLNAELPDPKQAGRYHAEQIQQQQKRMKSAVRMSFNAAAKKAKKEFDTAQLSATQGIAKKSVNAFRLSTMKKQVDAFVPPEGEWHAALKKGMQENLERALKSESDPSYYINQLDALKQPLTGQEWKAKEISDAKRKIEYHQKQMDADIERQTREVDFSARLRSAIKAQAPGLAKLG